MIAVSIIEVCLVLLLIWALIAQIIIPLKNGRPIFPMFGRLPKLQDELSHARQKHDENDLEKRIAEEKAKSTTEGS